MPALAPGSRGLKILLADTLRLRGIELLGSSRDRGPAVERLREASRILDDVALETPSSAASLAGAWLQLAEALAAGDPAQGSRGLGALARALEEVMLPADGGTGWEERFAGSILKSLLDLEATTRAGSPAGDSLSLLISIHSIQAILAERLAEGGQGDRPDAGLKKLLRAALRDLLQRAPHLQDRVPDGLR